MTNIEICAIAVYALGFLITAVYCVRFELLPPLDPSLSTPVDPVWVRLSLYLTACMLWPIFWLLSAAGGVMP